MNVWQIFGSSACCVKERFPNLTDCWFAARMKIRRRFLSIFSCWNSIFITRNLMLFTTWGGVFSFIWFLWCFDLNAVSKKQNALTLRRDEGKRIGLKSLNETVFTCSSRSQWRSISYVYEIHSLCHNPETVGFPALWRGKKSYRENATRSWHRIRVMKIGFTLLTTSSFSFFSQPQPHGKNKLMSTEQESKMIQSSYFMHEWTMCGQKNWKLLIWIHFDQYLFYQCFLVSQR